MRRKQTVYQGVPHNLASGRDVAIVALAEIGKIVHFAVPVAPGIARVAGEEQPVAYAADAVNNARGAFANAQKIFSNFFACGDAHIVFALNGRSTGRAYKGNSAVGVVRGVVRSGGKTVPNFLIRRGGFVKNLHRYRVAVKPGERKLIGGVLCGSGKFFGELSAYQVEIFKGRAAAGGLSPYGDGRRVRNHLQGSDFRAGAAFVRNNSYRGAVKVV